MRHPSNTFVSSVNRKTDLSPGGNKDEGVGLES